MWLSSIEAICQFRRDGFNPWVGKIPWRRKWQPTPIFLPGKSHGQRSLVGYSPGVAKSQTRLTTHAWRVRRHQDGAKGRWLFKKKRIL